MVVRLQQNRSRRESLSRAGGVLGAAEAASSFSVTVMLLGGCCTVNLDVLQRFVLVCMDPTVHGGSAVPEENL